MKTCTRCRAVLSLDAFTKDSRRKDGLNCWCRACTRANSKRVALENPEKAKERQARWYAENKDRAAARHKEWREKNPGKASEYCAKWREKNPGKNAECSRRWYAANREQALLSDKKARQENLEKFLIRERESYRKRAEQRSEDGKAWRKNNRPRVAYLASRRRSALALRTPPWLTIEELCEMSGFFDSAAQKTDETGVPHHVDHIVPLRGKTVSGLNVPWNLQVIPAIENLKKSNRHEP